MLPGENSHRGQEELRALLGLKWHENIERDKFNEKTTINIVTEQLETFLMNSPDHKDSKKVSYVGPYDNTLNFYILVYYAK